MRKEGFLSPASSAVVWIVWRRSCGGETTWGRVHVTGKAVLDSPGGNLHRIPREVGVACGGLDLAVTEELANHGQAFAEREGPGGE